MRVAALYDIHANLPALEAVIEEVRRANVDCIVVGGDVVPGPLPAETIAYLLELDLPVRCIRGNGDREVLARMRGIRTSTVPEPFRHIIEWTANVLPPDAEPVLASWPETVQLDVDGIGNVLFCHATPRDDNEIFTRSTPDDVLRPLFASLDASLVVCGHTHMQFDRTIGAMRVVNAGSVGMPFGEPGANWLLLGPDVRLGHTSYDLVRAAARIRDSAYPQADEFAERSILRPPSEKEMLDVFSAVELK